MPFLTGTVLAPGVHESYELPRVGPEEGTLFEHCVRAIAKASTSGVHGLPLFGTGDWNDGMNRVGEQGQGESTWLGFFLHVVLTEFAAICDTRRDRTRAARYRADAARLASSLEAAWDGEWFRRGYYDDGTPLGSAHNDECRIDSIAQSWAVISRAVPRRLAEHAVDSVSRLLVLRGLRAALLLTPPFDHSAQQPGYIKGYPPGIRENGGQYTHAAAWLVMALAELDRGDEAMELFHLINPVNHARTAADVERYKIEPYVVAGDVYSNPSHPGRGGWSWYTGSAGWMYRVGLERLLGLQAPRRHAGDRSRACRRCGPGSRCTGGSARRSTSSTSPIPGGTPAASSRRRSTVCRSIRPRSRSSTTAARTRSVWCSAPRAERAQSRAVPTVCSRLHRRRADPAGRRPASPNISWHGACFGGWAVRRTAR